MSEYAISLDYDLQPYASIVEAGRARLPDGGGRIVNAEDALNSGLIHEVDCLGMPAESVSWCVHA